MGDRSHEAIAALVEQLLDDPLIEMVMRADHVERAGARALLRSAALSVQWRGSLAGIDQEAAMTVSPTEMTGFRSGVGIMLFNHASQVFIAERIDMPGAWQMPQGGIEEGETPQAAALRELREEIGADLVEILTETRDWLRYELPPELAGHAWGGRWLGQQQKWFAMLFTGQDSDIDLATEHPEFTAWRWASLEDAISLTAPFKKPVYERVAREFDGLTIRTSFATGDPAISATPTRPSRGDRPDD